MWSGGTGRIMQAVEHRPWPLPRGRWIMFQSWRSLLFAHWRVPVDVLRQHVPEPLSIDAFDGTGWLGITPFLLSGLRARLLPAVPGLSRFPELNVRTYVRSGDRAGIWFFSLDAASTPAVMGARLAYSLPYHRADMQIRADGDWLHYHSRRNEGEAEFRARYRPTGKSFSPRPGTLEHFLIERYALFTVEQDGRVLRGDIHHTRWDVHPAEAVIEQNTMAQAAGVEIEGPPALLHFADRQDTVIWPPARDAAGPQVRRSSERRH